MLAKRGYIRKYQNHTNFHAELYTYNSYRLPLYSSFPSNPPASIPTNSSDSFHYFVSTTGSVTGSAVDSVLVTSG